MEMKGNILMKKYEIGRLLGQGAFAKVYHGRNLETGQSVAIKVINKQKVLKVGLMKQIKREISIMSKIKHRNIVHLEEVMATKTKIYFVMEYVKGGELFYKVAKGSLSEDVARKYFQQLICAVNFCHSRGVYHRDLKPENLLLDENGSVKITDFGLSALSESKQQDGLLHTTCGTPAYVAPEIINRRGYDGAKTDIWSCGVILYVLLAGHLPFHDTNIMQLYRKISRGECKYPSCVPRDVRKLLSRILDPNPCTRISIAEIMENSWFKNGLESENAGIEIGDMEKFPIDMDDVINPCQTQSDNVPETTLDSAKATNLNAFDIISFATGFDLSSFFVSNDQKDEVQFTSAKPFRSIVSKLEEIARRLLLKVTKKNVGLLRLERPNQSKDDTLSMEVQIFEITSTYYLVKVSKSTGDMMDYQHLLRKDIKPALGDIVWAWQGEKQNY